MNNWIERVREEKHDLDVLIDRLAVFLSSVDSLVVGESQKNLMIAQLAAMQSYSTVLDCRLRDVYQNTKG